MLVVQSIISAFTQLYAHTCTGAYICHLIYIFFFIYIAYDTPSNTCHTKISSRPRVSMLKTPLKTLNFKENPRGKVPFLGLRRPYCTRRCTPTQIHPPLGSTGRACLIPCLSDLAPFIQLLVSNHHAAQVLTSDPSFTPVPRIILPHFIHAPLPSHTT
jgi:hypothetical protein